MNYLTVRILESDAIHHMAILKDGYLSLSAKDATNLRNRLSAITDSIPRRYSALESRLGLPQ